MRYDRLFTDESGDSRFGEVDVPLLATDFAPPAAPVDISASERAASYVFSRAPMGWVGELHPAPRRQFYVGLAGELEVTSSAGEARRYGPGSLLLLEDVTGKGHVTRAVGGDAYGMLVQVDEP